MSPPRLFRDRTRYRGFLSFIVFGTPCHRFPYQYEDLWVTVTLKALSFLWCPVGTGHPETTSLMTHHQLPQTENTCELVTEALVSGPSVGQAKRKHVRQEGKKGSCGQRHEEVADVSQNCRGDFESLRPWRGKGRRYSVDRLHGNNMKGGCLEESLKMLYSGDWVLGADVVESFVGGVGTSFLFSPPAPILSPPLSFIPPFLSHPLFFLSHPFPSLKTQCHTAQADSASL